MISMGNIAYMWSTIWNMYGAIWDIYGVQYGICVEVHSGMSVDCNTKYVGLSNI